MRRRGRLSRREGRGRGGDDLDCYRRNVTALLRQDDMHDAVRGGVLGTLVTEAYHIDTGKELLAAPQKHRGNHEVNLVDQPGGEVLANRGDAAADPDVLFRRCFLRALQCG